MSGTTTFASIATSGTVNIGTTQANAILNLNGKKAVAGTDTWLRLNDTTAFTSGIYCGTGLLRTDGQFQLGSSGAKLAFTSTNDNSNIAGASGGHALFKIPIEMNGTSYYWDTSGNIKANDVNSSTGQINNLFVPNELRALSYSIETINSLGGAFYVAPTINVPAGNNVNITAISGTTITASISGSFSLTTFPQAIWAANSKVKVTGKIGGIPIGTCDGYLRAALTTSSIQVTFTYDGTKALTVANNQASEDVSVMIYSVGADKPIGIYMTAWGDTAWSDETAHNKSSISIYGGTTSSDTAPTTSTPVVRIGNLTDLPNISSGQITVQPKGWGIYTTHGYFSGSVVTNEGLIGGFTLYNNKLYTTNNTLGQGADNVYLSTDGISLGTTFKVTSGGALTAQSGTIGSNATAANNWQIGDRSIYYGNATPGYNASTLVLSTGTTSGKSIGGSGATTNTWMISAGTGFGVTSAGVMYATGAHIEGEITATSGRIGASNATNKIFIGTDATNASIYSGMNSISSSSNGFYIGTNGIALGGGKFKVTNAGVLTAKSGTIGSNATAANNWQIGDKSIYYGNATPGYNASTLVISTGTASTNNIGGGGTSSKTWMLSAGTGFGVTSAGVMYATGAHIDGEITATSGTIGASNASNKITIGTNTTNASIYYGMNSLDSTTATGFYIGADGISLGGGKFKVTSSGSATFKDAILGDSSSYHTAFDSQGLYIKNSGTALATFNSSGTRIGATGSNYIETNSTGISFGDADGEHMRMELRSYEGAQFETAYVLDGKDPIFISHNEVYNSSSGYDALSASQLDARTTDAQDNIIAMGTVLCSSSVTSSDKSGSVTISTTCVKNSTDTNYAYIGLTSTATDSSITLYANSLKIAWLAPIVKQTFSATGLSASTYYYVQTFNITKSGYTPIAVNVRLNQAAIYCSSIDCTNPSATTVSVAHRSNNSFSNLNLYLEVTYARNELL